jgi:hypothetical protein
MPAGLLPRQPLPWLRALWCERPAVQGQLADVGGARCADDGLVEIRILMDRVDPPAGRLSTVASADRDPGRQAEEIGFTGWLGLLRALYEATGAPDTDPVRGR